MEAEITSIVDTIDHHNELLKAWTEIIKAIIDGFSMVWDKNLNFKVADYLEYVETLFVGLQAIEAELNQL